MNVSAFQENVRLKSLNLAWNGLGLEGGAAVADALMTNQALLELDLSGNRLGLDTAKRMAKVLASNDSIRVLKVTASACLPNRHAACSQGGGHQTGKYHLVYICGLF